MTARPPPHAPHDEPAVQPHRRPRALVVDDQPLNLDLAAFVLDRGGFDVCTAADAPAACKQVALLRPDVVLLDIQLPGTDGVTLARQWKADPATRDMVLIAFTAYAMVGDEARMRAAGCDGYLAKPIDVDHFAAQVMAMLRERHPRAT